MSFVLMAFVKMPDRENSRSWLVMDYYWGGFGIWDLVRFWQGCCVRVKPVWFLCVTVRWACRTVIKKWVDAARIISCCCCFLFLWFVIPLICNLQKKLRNEMAEKPKYVAMKIHFFFRRLDVYIMRRIWSTKQEAESKMESVIGINL